MSRRTRSGFLGAAAQAFVRRRLHRQRMRLAAMRAIREVASPADARLWVDFDAGAEVLTHAEPWLSTYAADAL